MFSFWLYILKFESKKTQVKRADYSNLDFEDSTCLACNKLFLKICLLLLVNHLEQRKKNIVVYFYSYTLYDTSNKIQEYTVEIN